MAGIKDPAIKLFGKMIQLLPNSNGDSLISSQIVRSASGATTDTDCGCRDQNVLCSKQSENRGEENSSEEERSSSSVIEECKTPPSPSTPSKKDEQSDQASSTQSRDQNPPRKPDKILPCPRCSSMNTKFCYFNNYNVNQPRHFCKNCQRYWTAGGTMRNVPVGAGRRKNKNSSSGSQHHTLVIPAAPIGPTHQGLRPNGSLLTFGGSNSEPSESMPSPLNLIGNPASYNTTNGKENLGCSSNTNLTWNHPIPWDSRFPMSLYSTPPNWTPRTWNLQLLSTPHTCPDQSSSVASSNSTPLGKHARDGTLLKVSSSSNRDKGENHRLATPKSLRIYDPTGAAKSSIWDTLGINNDKVRSSINGGSFFNRFHQSKEILHHERSDQCIDGSYAVLQANPAAFSRSMAFHESAHPSC